MIKEYESISCWPCKLDHCFRFGLGKYLNPDRDRETTYYRDSIKEVNMQAYMELSTVGQESITLDLASFAVGKLPLNGFTVGLPLCTVGFPSFSRWPAVVLTYFYFVLAGYYYLVLACHHVLLDRHHSVGLSSFTNDLLSFTVGRLPPFRVSLESKTVVIPPIIFQAANHTATSANQNVAINIPPPSPPTKKEIGRHVFLTSGSIALGRKTCWFLTKPRREVMARFTEDERYQKQQQQQQQIMKQMTFECQIWTHIIVRHWWSDQKLVRKA